MKTDRELLELAAKAAGYREAGINKPYTDGLLENWNPLESDGDALRLAVKLLLNLDHINDHVHASHYTKDPSPDGWARSDGDRYAATRRAIVRAAAAIGEGMK